MSSMRRHWGGGAFSGGKFGLFTGITLMVLGASCGSEDKPSTTDSTGGDPGSSEAGATNVGGNAGESSTGGGNSTGGRTSRGGGTNVGEGGEPGNAGAGNGGQGTDGPEGPLEPGEDGPGFDGVDLDKLDLSAAPAGCVGGFDPDSGTLELTLDKKVPLVLLAVADGVMTANGAACESVKGVPASTDAITTVNVVGSDEDDSVYVDGASDFGPGLLGPDGDFNLELGDGDDELVVLGTNRSDLIQLGSESDAVWVDFSGDSEPDIRALGVERALVTTGPKSDFVLADGAALGIAPLAIPVKLFGGGANDLLLGGAADDDVHGGIGNDTLDAGRDAGGADRYDGGPGEDLVDYSARVNGVVVTLMGVADDGEAGEGDDVTTSVEDVIGSQGPNTIAGSAVGNRIWGGPSIDVVQGGDGDDFIYGGDGDDDLQGDAGDDFIYGEEGDDTLSGGVGDDLLDGYPGVNAVDGGLGDGDICLVTRNDKGTACEL
jgi:Ca2+-binding RTX toxin-like protein